MGFFRKIAGILGFAKDDEEEDDDNNHHHHHHHHRRRQPQQQNHNQYPDMEEQEVRRKGFSVQVPVAVDRAQFGPIITQTHPCDGGVQGLRWYAKHLRIDEDGDVADEFLDEVLSEVVEMSSGSVNMSSLPKFELKCGTRPAKVRKQRLSVDGKIQQSVECQGKLQWI